VVDLDQGLVVLPGRTILDIIPVLNILKIRGVSGGGRVYPGCSSVHDNRPFPRDNIQNFVQYDLYIWKPEHSQQSNRWNGGR
jgi:hypothetical protein